MSNTPISDSFEEKVSAYGTEREDLTHLEKTLLSKNITLSDWNELVQKYSVTEADSKRLYEALRKAIPELEDAINTTRSDLENADAALLKHVDRATAGALKFGGLKNTYDELPLDSAIGTFYVVIEDRGVYGKYSTWVHVEKATTRVESYRCISGELSLYVRKLNNPTNQALVQNGATVKGVPLGTAVGAIVQYKDPSVNVTSEGTLPVATPIYDGHAANKGYVDLNDVTDFTIEPAKDLEDNVVFGVYNFKVTLGSGDVLEHMLDLPFEAVQLASVDDYIGDDGKRYLEIRFADENIAPLNIELDEIFNFDVFSKQFIEKLESQFDEQVYLQDAEGNVTLHKVDYTASANSIVRRNSSRDILLKPTVSNDLAAVSKGQMEAYVNNAVKPYDVATDNVNLGYNQAYLKLTIDNLLDDNYASFQPFDLVCVGSDGMPMSSICTMFVEQYDQVRMLVYDSKHQNPPLYPQYYLSEEGNVHLYFDTYGEYLQVFIRGLVEKCTGATLEIIDALPDGVLDIDIERHTIAGESAGGGLTENDSNTLIGESEGSVVYLSDVSSTEEFVTCDLVDANLIQLADQTYEDNGFTYVVKDGIITVKGSPKLSNGHSYFYLFETDIPEEAQFELSGYPDSGPDEACITAYSAGSNVGTDTGDGVVFNALPGRLVVLIDISPTMRFTRYLKITPVLKRIDTPTTVSLRRRSKNLAVPPATTFDYGACTVTPNDDGTVTVSRSGDSGGNDIVDITNPDQECELIPGANYVVSVECSDASKEVDNTIVILKGLSDSVRVVDVPGVFTARRGEKFVSLSIYIYGDATYTYSAQVELGEVPTAFEKATEDVYTCTVVDGKIEVPSLSNMTLIAEPGVGLHTTYKKNITGDLRSKFSDVDFQLGKCVTHADTATKDRYGIVSAVADSGLRFRYAGSLAIDPASESDIDGRSSIKPIVPSNLEYAVKSVTYDKTEIDRSYVSLTPVPGSVILPETTSEVGVLEDGIAVLPTISLNLGSRYWVTYNGTKYVCECVDPSGDGTLALGSLDGTSEPFAIAVVNGVCACIPQDGSTSVTVSIIGEKMQVPLEQIPTVDVNTVLPLTYFEGEYVEEYGGYMYENAGGLLVVPGATYEVFFDNKTYTCVAKDAVIEDTPLILLGSDVILGGTSSEPFIVMTDGASFGLLCTFTEGEHAIKITTPAKFINGIAFSDTQIAAIEALIDAKLKEL